MTIKNHLKFVCLILTAFVISSAHLEAKIHTPQKNLKGKVEHFKGKTVLTGDPYEYYAFVPDFAQNQRIVLPSYLNGPSLFTDRVGVIFNASVTPMHCIDMSRACPTGKLQNIKVNQLDIPQKTPIRVPLKTVTGSVKFKILTLQNSPLPVKVPVFFIQTTTGSVQLPKYLNGSLLSAIPHGIQLEGALEGNDQCQKDKKLYCPDMRFKILKTIRLKF